MSNYLLVTWERASKQPVFRLHRPQHRGEALAGLLERTGVGRFGKGQQHHRRGGGVVVFVGIAIERLNGANIVLLRADEVIK